MGGERERAELQQQVGEMDWPQGKGKSAEVMLAGCGQKDTLQSCCPGLEEDMLFLGLTASELPINLKSHGREGFLFPVLVHHKNDNL